MCRMLDVKEGTYFAWRSRGESRRSRENREYAHLVRLIVASSNNTYGSRRATCQLRKQGHLVNRKRIAGIMRRDNIRPFTSCKAYARYPSPPDNCGENILDRRFKFNCPNAAWASDITNIPTRQGWLYLAVIMDLFSRCIIGWSMDRARTGQLVIDAFSAAIANRRPNAFIHHSDRGTQYTSSEYIALIKHSGGTASFSRKGNCWDNAVVESFFATLKRELLQGKTFATRDEARVAVFDYIESWYNRHRLHSTLGYLTPVEFEGQSA